MRKPFRIVGEKLSFRVICINALFMVCKGPDYSKFNKISAWRLKRDIEIYEKAAKS